MYEFLYLLPTHIQRSNIDHAAREINSLQGLPREIARDWLNDARTYLEVAQAINVLRAYVSVTGLSLL